MSCYPHNWDAIREAVRVRDERCMNCRVSPDEATLDVHHIVPLGQGGSNRMGNLVLLCRRCHDAAHGEEMAPIVKFHSNGSMTNTEFEGFTDLLGAIDYARFNPDDRYWYIPKADVDRVVSQYGS